jgi:(1->4)-alpha-D-glucan 1-alpha-D-glucosylmutase
VRLPPRATYRVQLREEFDFDDAAGVVAYLAALGVSHLYCSPYMQAAAHSSHGYDVVDPTRISEDLGGEAGLRRLDGALVDAHMGQLLDIVPNHMCIGDRANAWWWDVLLQGRRSRFAAFFDIDWDAPATDGRVLLPVLVAPRDVVMAAGELVVVDVAGALELHYQASAFPLTPGTGATPGPVTVETLAAQHYLLEYGAVAAAHLNYRRFADVSSLAGVRVDDEAVFVAMLDRALKLVYDGTVDGLRIDHIDGLRDPAAFAQRLRSAVPHAWLIAEKILAAGECLPANWPLDGTTGYDFVGLTTSLLVDPAGLTALTDCARDFTGDDRDFQAHAHLGRTEAIDNLLRAELGRLIRVAAHAGLDGAAAEIVELIAAMPRYRLYPRGGARLSDDDTAALQVAGDDAQAGARQGDTERRAALLALLRGDMAVSPAGIEFRERFQQVSAAVTAKGVEDTAFYRYVRMVGLNEVGADPDHTSSLDDFHRTCIRNVTDHPLTLLATTTHDTKRGEDARLRICLLAEMPDRWRAAVTRLDALGASHRGSLPPARNAEYLFYQTLVAAHPIDADRAWAYMLKASREAKEATSWIEPDQAYEEDLERFVRAMVADPAVTDEIGAVVAAMTPQWQHLSLSQTLLKLTAPGVPDIYQGSELWDLRLVDPDNRTPVDYDVRRRLLGDVRERDGTAFMDGLDEGAPKIALIARALAVRARCPDGFGPGSGYQRLPVSGSREHHAICFSRTRADDRPVTVTIAHRWPLILDSAWLDTEVLLPGGDWRDALTGRAIAGGEQRLAALLEAAPVALLERV